MLVLSSDVIYTIINIALLCVLLRIFLWKPVLGIIEKRRQTIQDDLDEAARNREETETVQSRGAAFSLGACCLLPQCLLVIIPFIQGAQVWQPLLTSGIGKCLECRCKG